ncbi:Hsp20/alpha crystallin family protein [Plebeiibacterium sediminum]|uniref:HSP20 family small heat-shock protein n=1 Tax=Plebeiibacterium sediminum TaxID=2992112 RepID=A0AAE3M210_9BACT|nr:Hsp20 family protein [Plebeiobacterium sediminum]MCW3785397.1 HSP20 family small heat-shock protein [Plebeiobacterium sediminum]
MKTLISCYNPFYGISPFFDLDIFEPVIYGSSVFESIKELPDSYQIEYEVPGFKKRQLNIKVEGNILRIEGINNSKNNGLFSKNKRYNEEHFIRETYLSNDMDADRISAKYKNGILQISIPKKGYDNKHRQIPVYGEEIVEPVKSIKDRYSLRDKIKRFFKK